MEVSHPFRKEREMDGARGANHRELSGTIHPQLKQKSSLNFAKIVLTQLANFFANSLFACSRELIRHRFSFVAIEEYECFSGIETIRIGCDGNHLNPIQVGVRGIVRDDHSGPNLLDLPA